MVDSAARKILIACVAHNFNVQGMLYPSGEIRGQIAVAAMLLALAACGGGSGEEAPPLPTLQPTLASIQANIFTPSCAKSGCHTGAGAQQGLILDSGSSWGNLFNVDSSEIMTLKRVNPGMPDLSYLIHKLEGMQTGGGQIVGMQMPADGPPFLQQATIDVIRLWIANGAPQ